MFSRNHRGVVFTKKAVSLGFSALVFLSLASVLLSSQPVLAQEPILIERGPNFERWELGGGKFAWNSAPQWILDDPEWVPYIYERDNAKKCYIVQSGLIAAEIYDDGHASFHDPAMTDIRVKSETWVIEYSEGGNWKSGSLVDSIDFNIIQEGNDISIERTQPTSKPLGTLKITYIFREGSALKHEVVWTSGEAETVTVRVKQMWDLKLDTSKVTLEDGTTSTTGEYKSAYYLFKSDANDYLVFERQLKMIYDENGAELTEGRFTGADIDFSGKKVIYTFENWTLAQGESLTIDPDTATLSDPTEDGHIKYDTDSPSDYIRFNTGDAVEPAYAGQFHWTTRGYFEWDISSIDDSVTITDTVFRYDGWHRAEGDPDCQVREMVGVQPSSEADDDSGNQAIYDEIGEGTIYYVADGFPVIGQNQEVDLGASADTDLQNQLSGDWFAIGVQIVSESGSRGCGIYSEEYGSATPKPSLYIEYLMPPPNPPTSLLTEGQTNPTQIIDTQPEFSAIGTDNNGDNMNYYALQVDDDSGFGSTIWNKTKTAITEFENGARCLDISYAGSALTRGTTYYWRIKFWDIGDMEGSWSTETATFVLNQLPTAPTNPTNLGANLTDHSPNITWTEGTDGDGGDIVTTFIFLGTDSTPTEVDGSTTNETFNLGENASHSTYPLVDGSTYYYRLRSWDGLEYSAYTTADQFRLNTPPAVPTSINNLGMNLTDHSPDKTFTKGTDAESDTVYTIASLGTSGSPTEEDVQGTGTTLTLGENSSHSTYPLVDGTTYYVRLRSWDGYEYSASYTADDQFRMNTPPTLATNWTNLGMNLVDHTPTVTWTEGTDVEGDTITSYIYVGTTSTPTAEETNTTDETADLGSTITLNDGVTYYYRFRTHDGYEYSGYTAGADQFRMNTPPTTTDLETEGQTNPTKVVTFTPEFSWTYADDEGDSQSHWQIWVGSSSGTNDLWNSGELSGADASDIYDGSALSRGVTYYVQVATKDVLEWSSWTQGTFKINWAPTQVYSEQMFYEDFTPLLEWDFNDADGDSQLGVKIQVDNDADFGSLMWDHSDTTTTDEFKVYAGDALDKNVTYYARVQVRDGYEWAGTWSENTFTILPIPSLIVTSLSVDGSPIDRMAHWDGDGDVRIYATIKDNEGRDAIENAFFWVRDNEDNVVVDNEMYHGYENVDENTKRFWIEYDPINIMTDSAIGEFDVKVQAMSVNFENTKDYTDLGFKLFKVDDHSISFSPVREIYAEGEIITFEPTVKYVDTGLAVDNAYMKIELVSELEEVLRTIEGYTNGSGKLAASTSLIEVDIGYYDVKISTSKGEIDGLKLYEDSFRVVAEILVSSESLVPEDTFISGLLRSRSIAVEEVIVKVKVFDSLNVEILDLTSDPLQVENVNPQLLRWEVDYGFALAEGTYSYRVEVWSGDLSVLHHVSFAEVRLTTAASQQSVGEWVAGETIKTVSGSLDVIIMRESIVTNHTTVDKSNFFFREVIPAPSGSSVMVKIEGAPAKTLTVDQYGTISEYFDVPRGETIKVEMEVLIIEAVKIEALGSEEVVAAVPETVSKHQYKVTSLTGTTLREMELVFPVEGVISVVDEDGKPFDFWHGGSTVVLIPTLDSYAEIILTLTTKRSPDVGEAVEKLITWTFWGIPIIVFTLLLGTILSAIKRKKTRPLLKVIIVLAPSGVLVLALMVGIV